jgi:hypothetical protein
MNTVNHSSMGNFAKLALGEARRLGMAADNEQYFLLVVCFMQAATSLKMFAAAARAEKIAQMLLQRSAKDIERSILPSQKISAGLSAEAKDKLNARAFQVLAELAS